MYTVYFRDTLPLSNVCKLVCALHYFTWGLCLTSFLQVGILKDGSTLVLLELEKISGKVGPLWVLVKVMGQRLCIEGYCRHFSVCFPCLLFSNSIPGTL